LYYSEFHVETITLRLPPKQQRNSKKFAKKEGKDRSTLIRELLENGVKEKSIEQAVELYRTVRLQLGKLRS